MQRMYLIDLNIVYIHKTIVKLLNKDMKQVFFLVFLTDDKNN